MATMTGKQTLNKRLIIHSEIIFLYIHPQSLYGSLNSLLRTGQGEPIYCPHIDSRRPLCAAQLWMSYGGDHGAFSLFDANHSRWLYIYIRWCDRLAAARISHWFQLFVISRLSVITASELSVTLVLLYIVHLHTWNGIMNNFEWTMNWREEECILLSILIFHPRIITWN